MGRLTHYEECPSVWDRCKLERSLFDTKLSGMGQMRWVASLANHIGLLRTGSKLHRKPAGSALVESGGRRIVALIKERGLL